MTRTIPLSPATLLNDLLWQATRYCIGRRSYVSTNAEHYAGIIRRNRDKFSPDRLRFYARDIRAEISQHLHFSDNIFVENNSNDRIKHDAYSLLCRHLGGEKPKDGTLYRIDCITGRITDDPMKPKEHPNIFDPQEWECDLRPWVLLANSIDRRYMITCKRDGLIETCECTVDHQGRYTCTDSWNRHPIPELITDITPID